MPTGRTASRSQWIQFSAIKIHKGILSIVVNLVIMLVIYIYIYIK